MNIELLKGQAEFFDSRANELMYSGAWGAGKSLILCLKAIWFAQRGVPTLLCRKRLTDFKSSTLRVLKRLIGYNYKDWNKSNREIYIKYPEGFIHYTGLDDPIKIRSSWYAFIGVDEGSEIELDDWLELSGRLRAEGAPYFQLATTTNPSSNQHFLYKLFFENNDNKITRHVVQSNTFDNPYLPKAYIDRLEDLPTKYKMRYVNGLWISFEGQVYEDFSNDCIIDNFNPPDNWHKFGGIDFGYTNPFVFQYWTEDPATGIFYLTDEIYKTKCLVEDIAKMIRQIIGNRVVSIYADHDAEDRATLERHGIKTKPAQKDIQSGVQYISELFKQKKIKFFKNTLRHPPDLDCQINNNPVCTVQEIPNYEYPRVRQGVVSEIPIKKNDHGCDAMRYALYSFKNRFKPSFF